MKFIKIPLLFAAMAGLSGFASAATGVVDSKFESWVGHDQKGYYLDPSSWAECASTKGGSCPTVSKATGHSECKSQGFNIGVDWTPKQLGGMNISGSYNKSWSACNTHSETVSCTPNKGYKGRAVVHFGKRWGRQRVIGAENYFNIDNDCKAGFKAEWMGGSSWRCTYVGGRNYTVDGYLPEFRNAACQYKHL